MARLRGKRWQADVRLAGGGRLRPTFPTKAQAEAWEAQARLAIEQGKPLPEARTASRPGSTARDLTNLGNLFDHVCRTEWDTMRAARTLKINGQAAVDHFGQTKDVRAILAPDIADYAVTLAEKGNAPGTVNRKIAALSKLLNTAVNAGALDKVPVIRWRREEKTKFRFIDQKEEAVILAYWRNSNYERACGLTMFLIDSGARCFAEAIPVKWDHFGKDFANVTFWTTKTFKPRTVPLTKRVREWLTDWKRRHPDSAGPWAGMNKHTFTHRWRSMQELLGFPDVTPHTMRHTCCTRLVLGGADVKRVMEWIGHASIATTMRYMQVRPDSLDCLLEVLEGG